MEECQRWMRKLSLTRKEIEQNVNLNDINAKAKALEDYGKLAGTIRNASEHNLEEASHFMEDEESIVKNLIEQGLGLPVGFPEPEAQSTEFQLEVPRYVPYNFRRHAEDPSETTSRQSLTLSIITVESSSKVDNEMESGFDLREVQKSKGPFPSKPEVIQTVLELPHVSDIGYSEGLLVASAANGGFWIQDGEKPLKRVAKKCKNQRLYVSKGRVLWWTSRQAAGSETAGVKKCRLLTCDTDSMDRSDLRNFKVRGGGRLCGLAWSTAGLIAVCDLKAKQITVHETNRWSRVDTLRGEALFGNELGPSEITWLDEDHLCIIMSDRKTIHCMSLSFKKVVWTKEVPFAWLLSAAFGRVYVSLAGPPARFVIIRGDSGEVLTEEGTNFEGAEALKVFPNQDGGVIAFTRKV